MVGRLYAAAIWVQMTRDSPNLEVCWCLSISPKYRPCVWQQGKAAGFLKALRRVREGPNEPIHEKGEAMGWMFDLSQVVRNQLSKDSYVDP